MWLYVNGEVVGRFVSRWKLIYCKLFNGEFINSINPAHTFFRYSFVIIKHLSYKSIQNKSKLQSKTKWFYRNTICSNHNKTNQFSHKLSANSIKVNALYPSEVQIFVSSHRSRAAKPPPMNVECGQIRVSKQWLCVALSIAFRSNWQVAPP